LRINKKVKSDKPSVES